MFIKIDSLYDIISTSLVVFNLYYIYNFNIIILLGFLLCVFFQDFFKEVTFGWLPFLFKRPNGANNCSLFNSGGLIDHKSGFPSGHVSVISFLMIFLLLEKETNLFNTNNIYYFIPIVLIGYARIKKGAHNLFQVLGGYMLGLIIAYIMYFSKTSINQFVDYIYSQWKVSELL